MPSRLVKVATCLFLSLLLSTTASPALTTTEQRRGPVRAFPPVELSAPGASGVVVDGQTGEVVFEKDANRRRAPASITKIVTALVALRYDDPDRVVTVHVDWYDLEDSTLMGLWRGERLSIEDLLYGLMLPSGNDAAVAIARAVAGSEHRFVDLMNEEARRLGLHDTHFVNPHGLDAEGHYTSAHDIALLAREAMRDPVFRRVAGTRQIEVNGRGYYPLRNINRFVWNYPDADGVKNGFTDNAGLTVVASATRNGKRAIAAVMGSWDYVGDAAALLDAYFSTRGERLLTSGTAGAGRLDPPDPAARPPHQWIDVPPSRIGYVRRSLAVQ